MTRFPMRKCLKCLVGSSLHPWHDNGTPHEEHQGEFRPGGKYGRPLMDWETRAAPLYSPKTRNEVIAAYGPTMGPVVSDLLDEIAPRNPHFNAVLQAMSAIHERKNKDYADDNNPYSNFEGAARLAGVSVDTVFHIMLGIKMERLRQLVSGKEPNFETLDDTLLDLANYAALWLSYRRSAPLAR